MKKGELAKLALLGISAGLMVGGCHQKKDTGTASQGSADEQMSQDMQSFYSSLSSDAQKKFVQLDAQHKMMAVEMAQQGCHAKNKCAAMGGCATSDHGCAGLNACKGQGGAPVKDANKAVEIQYKNQMAQRSKTSGGMGSSADATPSQQGPSSQGSSEPRSDRSSRD